MIIVDPRVGSGELAGLLDKLSIPFCIETLDSADFAFTGNGPDGEISIGIERKALSDFLTCMNNERFTGFQLEKLLKSYHYTFTIVEGIYRPGFDGFIEECIPVRDQFGNEKRDIYRWRRAGGRKGVLYSQLEGHLTTLRLKAGTPNAGFIVINTSEPYHTASVVAHLFHWFNKPWQEHQSHIGFYDPVSIFRAKSSFERRFAMQFDNIGFERAGAIEQRFPGIDEMISPTEQMMAATEKDWAEIDGIGQKSAESIYRQLHWRNEVKPPKKRRKKSDVNAG